MIIIELIYRGNQFDRCVNNDYTDEVCDSCHFKHYPYILITDNNEVVISLIHNK